MKFNGSIRLGETSVNRLGHKAIIVKYNSATDIDIKFEDGTISCSKNYADFKRGAFSNKNYPVYYGVGYVGIGKYNTSNDKKACDVWVRMLDRCYNKESKYHLPTYDNVSVCKEWYNFQVFCKWFYDNYDSVTMKGWALDKDIICPSCRIYSPDTCDFVPTEVNTLFTKRESKRGTLPIGVKKFKNRFRSEMSQNGSSKLIGYFLTIEEAFTAYKNAKELYIKKVADKWRGLISNRVYEAMYKYEVRITD